MSYIRFDGLKKPTAIAKALKKTFKVDTLSNAKDLVARLTNYSNWTHLKRETEKESSESLPMTHNDVVSISNELSGIDDTMKDKDITAYVAELFSFIPSSANELCLFITNDDQMLFDFSLEMDQKMANDKVLPKGGEQSVLDIEMEAMQEQWKDRYYLSRAAMFYHLATDRNCARAQVHIGRMFTQGCLGFIDLQSSIELMSKGLEYRSDNMFRSDGISMGNLSVLEMQAGTISDWSIHIHSIISHNHHEAKGFCKNLMSTCDRALFYANKIKDKLLIQDSLGSIYYNKATAIAFSFAIDQNMDADLFKEFMDCLKNSAKYKDQRGQRSLDMLTNVFICEDRGDYKELPVNDFADGVLLQCLEMTGAFVPSSREDISKIIIDNIVEQTYYTTIYTDIVNAPLSLMRRIDEDIQQWPI